MGHPGAPGGARNAGRRGGENSLNNSKWRNGLSRSAMLGACAVAAAAVVAACGGGGDSGSSGGGSAKKVDTAAALKKPTTLTVWAWTPGTAKAVAMFEKAYPNIKVNLQNVGQGP